MNLHPDTLNFLSLIKENNTRHFFGIIKPLYEQVRNQLVAFAGEAINKVKKIDDNIAQELKPKDCLYRIYRDARRLKEGDPVYKTNLGLVIAPNGKNDSRPGYYLHIQPGGSFFGGGVYWPSGEEQLNLRHYLLKNGNEYKKLISNKTFVGHFGQVHGESLQKAPRGFPKEHKFMDLIMKKQHLIYHHYTDKQVLSDNFMELFLQDCEAAKDRFDFLSKGYAYKAWKMDAA